MKKDKLRVAFLHPDLGIGGAEQLVVNLAMALQGKGHEVKIYTPYHNKNHCFEETRNGTLKVEVRGSCFPRTIFGRFIALCAFVRMILAALFIVLYGGHFDLIIVDQVSVCVPILRLFRKRVLFYCHFPDKLLCYNRKNPIKKLYRFFLDLFEEVSLIPANKILVNSTFTRKTFLENFKILQKMKFYPDILYPATDFEKFDENIKKLSKGDEFKLNFPYFMSLNRYERKKNINLALHAYAEFKRRCPSSDAKLVIVGGYDKRVTENVEHLEELKKIALDYKIQDDVIFKVSVSDSERCALLQGALAVLYTPENEHFGIVPIEAMYMEKPVIANNSGGPTETIKNNETGFLLNPDKSEWAEKMKILFENSILRTSMGKKGKIHSKESYGLETFANLTENASYEACSSGKNKEKKKGL